jgi:hypothetical protein
VETENSTLVGLGLSEFSHLTLSVSHTCTWHVLMQYYCNFQEQLGLPVVFTRGFIQELKVQSPLTNTYAFTVTPFLTVFMSAQVYLPLANLLRENIKVTVSGRIARYASHSLFCYLFSSSDADAPRSPKPITAPQLSNVEVIAQTPSTWEPTAKASPEKSPAPSNVRSFP